MYDVTTPEPLRVFLGDAEFGGRGGSGDCVRDERADGMPYASGACVGGAGWVEPAVEGAVSLWAGGANVWRTNGWEGYEEVERLV